MAKWVLAAKRADFDAIGRKYNISPVLARIIRNRDVCLDEEYDLYLNGTLDNLHDATQMTDMVKACSLLSQYISENKKIRIIGDYDVDGVCATYILLQGIRACGGDVDYAVPHRITDGYGLNVNLVKSAYDDGREVIITCDNGISAASQIEYANSLGMHVIVTDHHEVPYEIISEEGEAERIELLPPAEAVVDPKRAGDNYPFAGICGAVVAWKLIGVLLPMCGVNKVDADNLMEALLEEAAIATVGDIMELRDENRIIVKEGLARLQNTRNVGLKSLINAVGLADKRIVAYHIGFIIGPCINATGRLDSADRALKLLECNDRMEAAVMSDELRKLNDARKEMTELGFKLAIADVEESEIGSGKVLVLYLPGVHESLAGIIAGRIREKYERPTIVLTDAHTEGDSSDGSSVALLKGSARSVEAYDMLEGLTKCKDLFTNYGGHKMAAGMSLHADNLDEFRRRINDDCGLTEDELVTKLTIDVPLPMSLVSFSFIDELSKLEPFGNGNPKPVFAQKDLVVQGAKVLGKLKNVLILNVADDKGKHFELKLFNQTDTFMDAVDSYYGPGTSGDLTDRNQYSADGGRVTLDAIYYPGVNEYNGRRSIEYIVNDYRFK